MLAGLRPGGTVLINAPWKTFQEVEAAMPAKTKTRMAALRPKVGAEKPAMLGPQRRRLFSRRQGVCTAAAEALRY